MEKERPTYIDVAKRPAPRIENEEQAEQRKITRRNFLAAATSLAAITGMAPAAFARNFGPETEPQRYPEPDVMGLDKRFRYKNGNTAIVRLHTGMMWAEGICWNGQGRYAVWSDIPNDEQLRWNEEDGHIGRRFRYPSGNSNGNSFDFQGRELSCEHGNRRVVRYEHDGSMTVLADQAGGKGLNAPNDIAVNKLDDSIWFTDPGYGALMNYEGHRLPESKTSPSPLQKEATYRIDAKSGAMTKVSDEPFKPNGICFSPDYKICYIADTGASHYAAAKNIVWAYDVAGDKLKNPRKGIDMEWNGKAGFADGIRCDEDGNIWVGAGWVGDGYDGVHIFAPNGDRIGYIKMPEIIANLCFGGSKRNRLLMAGSQSIYAVYVETRGATPF